MQLPLALDLLVGALLLVGTAFALIGSYGLARLSDFFKRLHGPTKASTLGVGCVLVASILYFTFRPGAVGVSLHELLITLFVFLTAPISAHLLVKAALVLEPSARPAPPKPPAQGPGG
ncbi:MAG: Na+/H+ antiporter subunit G [Burkholderiales bacterium]|jgi:multicomponent K+:H+ antiporter subunit G|nr:Na+/H+ antiporter subunit G [Burkholderiales bacterium]